LRVGYFAQHQAEELDLSVTPLVEMARRRPQDTEQQIRNHLGRFNFSKPRAETKIGNLSGGEKARLLFALMTLTKPHILLLDEPTNHLDMDSRQALVEAINAFEGAVVLISHDPHVLELTVDRFWLVDGGKVTPFEGDMDDYRALLLGAKPGNKSSQNQNTSTKKEHRPASLKPLQKKLEKAEETVIHLSAERDRLNHALTDPKLYSGPSAELANIQTHLTRVHAEIEKAEGEWITIQEQLEQLQQRQ
jgi:ATP-binding cassette subfamily F protein 3